MKRAYLKRVLAGSMSLALAASLCPALPALAAADDATPAAAEQQAATLADGNYHISYQVQKAEDGTEFKMFPIEVTSAIASNGKLTVNFNTGSRSTYDIMYLGSAEEAQSESADSANRIAGIPIEVDGVKTVQFSVELDASQFGTTVPVALGKSADGSFYTSQELQLAIGTPVVVLENGTYSADELSTDFGMFSLSAEKRLAVPYVVVKDDKAYIVITNGTYRYDEFAWGTKDVISDTLTGFKGTPVYKEGKSEADGTGEDAVAGYQFVLELTTERLQNVLDGADEGLFYVVRYIKGYSADHDGDWYVPKNKDYSLSMGTLVRTGDSTLLPGEEASDPEPAAEPESESVADQAQTIKLTGATKTFKAKALKKAKKTFTVKVSGAKGALAVTPNSKAKKAKIKAVASGKTKVKVTVPKKTAKGTYKISVKAKKATGYKASAAKTIKVKVK